MTQSAADTSRTVGRRSLKFASLEEMLADAKRIAESDSAGKLKRAGNWTAGQCMHHVASWMDYSFDGYPMKVPFLFRVIGRVLKPLVLSKGMPANRWIPSAPGGTYAMDDLPVNDALARLESAAKRLRSSTPPNPSPLFGKLTHDQWIALNLRHAELHFSFLIPR